MTAVSNLNISLHTHHNRIIGPEILYQTPMLSRGQKFAFSVGHMINDLTASMWFSYLLVFFIHVLSFPNHYAGYLLLIGQIADALSTVFVGAESDRTNQCLCSYPRRKSWHLLGLLCTVLSFPFIFLPCIRCSKAQLWAQMLYYTPFVIIFQFGWASIQISHLSMINEMSNNEVERVTLTSYRNAFAILSNIIVYFAVTVLLHSSQCDSSSLSPDEAPVFLKLSIIVLSTGIVSSLIFHVFTKGNYLEQSDSESNQTESFSFSGLLRLFANGRFYLIAAIYMCSRLIANVTQVYLPLFVTSYIEIFGKNTIGIAPLVCYLSGIVASFLVRASTKTIGKIPTLFLAVITTFSYSAIFFFVLDVTALGISPKVAFLIASSLLGIASAGLVIVSLSIISDIISLDMRYNAFVYGTMSFTDKVSNGAAVALLQHFAPSVDSSKATSYVHLVIALFPSSVAVIETILLIMTCIFHIMPPSNPLLSQQITSQDEEQPLRN